TLDLTSLTLCGAERGGQIAARRASEGGKPDLTPNPLLRRGVVERGRSGEPSRTKAGVPRGALLVRENAPLSWWSESRSARGTYSPLRRGEGLGVRSSKRNCRTSGFKHHAHCTSLSCSGVARPSGDIHRALARSR